MSEPYQQMLAALRDGTGFVHLDVQAPRDAPIKQCMAHLFKLDRPEHRKPQGQASSMAISVEQARELLDAGAEWAGPSHLRSVVIPPP